VTLLAEVLGVLAIAAIVRVAWPGTSSLKPAITVVIVVLAGFGFWAKIWPRVSGLVREHSQDSQLTAEQALSIPGVTFGANASVLAWADGALPREASVFLDCTCANGLANWITYRLQPRFFTELPAQAQWILFYNTQPSTLSSPRITDLEVLASGYAIARVRK
jgi:hypothetical protein